MRKRRTSLYYEIQSEFDLLTESKVRFECSNTRASIISENVTAKDERIHSFLSMQAFSHLALLDKKCCLNTL